MIRPIALANRASTKILTIHSARILGRLNLLTTCDFMAPAGLHGGPSLPRFPWIRSRRCSVLTGNKPRPGSVTSNIWKLLNIVACSWLCTGRRWEDSRGAGQCPRIGMQVRSLHSTKASVGYLSPETSQRPYWRMAVYLPVTYSSWRTNSPKRLANMATMTYISSLGRVVMRFRYVFSVALLS